MTRRWSVSMFAGAMCLAAGAARAQSGATEISPTAGLASGEYAARYARGSQTLLGTLSLAGGTPLASATSPALAAFGMELVAAGRFVVNGVAIEPRFGAIIGLTQGSATAASTVTVTVVPGIGVGYAMPVAPNLAITPMLTYGVVFSAVNATNALVGHQLVAELPLSIFVGRNGMLEPFAFAGVTVPSFSNPGFALGAGFRVGVTF